MHYFSFNCCFLHQHRIIYLPTSFLHRFIIRTIYFWLPCPKKGVTIHLHASAEITFNEQRELSKGANGWKIISQELSSATFSHQLKKLCLVFSKICYFSKSHSKTTKAVFDPFLCNYETFFMSTGRACSDMKRSIWWNTELQRNVCFFCNRLKFLFKWPSLAKDNHLVHCLSYNYWKHH